MSNEERVKKLAERISVELEHSDTLKSNKNSIKPDKIKLKKLAREIQKNLEDYPIEVAAHPHSS